MTKIGRPNRLIGYDNDINIQRRQDGKAPIYRIVRAAHRRLQRDHRGGRRRSCSMRWRRAACSTSTCCTTAIPVAVRLSDGSIRNAYTVRLLNKSGYDRVIAIDADGPVNATIHVVGVDSVTPDRPMIVVPRDSTSELRLLVTAPAREQSGKVDPGSLPRHRYRARRGRQRHRQFRRALDQETSPWQPTEAADRNQGAC